MSNTVISIEEVSKMYRLGAIGAGNLRHDLNKWWYQVRGKENPYLKLGEANDRTKKASSEYVWVLQDINLAIKQGETVGIIGRNGAGKSTLLKIMSRVTQPTKGQIKIKGRVASLLEVGTGFHPELTGRENIFLNGAILGMRKKEIQSKLDEIIDFSGVERYLDTPVKRYSSGMYVRLAFGVAAHLESEILIVDEVLAVGDAEFQKKCLGKMNDATTKEGRTVLFVSHNMAAVQNLTNVCVHLQQGRVIDYGQSDTVIRNYLRLGNESVSFGTTLLEDRIRSKGSKRLIKEAWITNEQGEIINTILMGSSFAIHFRYESEIDLPNVLVGFGIETELGSRITTMNNDVMGPGAFSFVRKGIASCRIDQPNLSAGTYFISLAMVNNGTEWLDFIEQAITLTIEPFDVFQTGKLMQPMQGFIFQHGEISIQESTL